MSIPKIVKSWRDGDSYNRTEAELNIPSINLSYNINELINIYEDYSLSILLGSSFLYGGYVKYTGYWNDSEEPTLSNPYFFHLSLSIPDNYEIYINRKYIEIITPHNIYKFLIISLGLGYKF